jgi:hypothetical protein
MRLAIRTTLLLFAFSQFGWGQIDRNAMQNNGEETVAPLSPNNYSVIGAAPKQEALLRAQIQIMHPEIFPLRIVFVPHWKYVDTSRTFQLHVPAGYTSAMFTHLASRTVFIDSDRCQGEDWLGYWMAHELGHLATNSTKESDADKAAGKFRARLKASEKFAAQASKP